MLFPLMFTLRRSTPKPHLPSKSVPTKCCSTDFHIWELTVLLYYCRYKCDIALLRQHQMPQLSNKINLRKHSPS